MKNVRIIVEGADGAGKSTLVNRLYQYFKFQENHEVDKVHMRGKDTMSFPFLYHGLDKCDIIYDRHFLSENIYSDFYNLPKRITESQRDILMDKCRLEGIVVIVCIPQVHKMYESEDVDIKMNHSELVQAYVDIVQHYNLLVVDPMNDQFEEIIDKIKMEYNVLAI